MKIIANPTCGCGGLLSCLINNVKPDYYTKKFIHTNEVVSLKLLDLYKLEDEKSTMEWNDKVQKHLGNQKWLGTHIHPEYFYLDKNITKIIYVYCSKIESISWLAVRHFFYCQDDFKNFSVSSFASVFLNFLIKLNWFEKTEIYRKKLEHNKILNIDLSNFIFDKVYRKTFFTTNNLNYNESVFDEWLEKNDYSKFYPVALEKLNYYYSHFNN